MRDRVVKLRSLTVKLGEREGGEGGGEAGGCYGEGV